MICVNNQQQGCSSKNALHFLWVWFIQRKAVKDHRPSCVQRTHWGKTTLIEHLTPAASLKTSVPFLNPDVYEYTMIATKVLYTRASQCTRQVRHGLLLIWQKRPNKPWTKLNTRFVYRKAIGSRNRSCELNFGKFLHNRKIGHTKSATKINF